MYMLMLLSNNTIRTVVNDIYIRIIHQLCMVVLFIPILMNLIILFADSLC